MPKPPTFIQIDPNALNTSAVQQEQTAVKDSQADALSRLGSLYPSEQSQIADAYGNITGKQDPIIDSSLGESGIGPVNLGSNDYAQSRSLYGDSNVLEKTQRDRNYFSRLWQENPEHAYGLGANDYLNTVIANSGGQAQFQQGILDASAAAQNQAAAASGANIAALGSIAGNIGKAASGLPAISGSGGGNYLDSGYYAGDTNTSPGVTGGSDFYTGDPSEVSTFDSSGGGL